MNDFNYDETQSVKSEYGGMADGINKYEKPTSTRMCLF